MIGQEDNLVIDNALCSGDAVDERHQIHRHSDIVDFDIGIGFQKSWHHDAIYIYKAIDFQFSTAQTYLVIRHLETVQRYILIGKVLHEETLHIVSSFICTQELGINTSILELVLHLTDLHTEIIPLACIIAEEFAFLVLLCDGDISGTIGIFASSKVPEIAFREKLLVSLILTFELSSGEHILFVDRVTIAKCRHQCCQQVGKSVVVVDVGTMLLNGILHSEYG